MNLMGSQSQHNEICILPCTINMVAIKTYISLYRSPPLSKLEDLPDHTGSGVCLDHNQEDFFEDECRTLFCVPLHQERLHQKV